MRKTLSLNQCRSVLQVLTSHEPVKTYLQVSDFVAYLVSYARRHRELKPEHKLFLIDFVPNLQDVMDYDSTIEMILLGDFSEYIFAACGDKQLTMCLKKHGLVGSYVRSECELTPENL
jgi:hypothetical protein